MPRKRSAIERIDNHEKICRLMQKQTFDKIDKIEERISRLEKYISGALLAILLAVLSNHF
jgi:hypothetical protein